MLFITKHYGIWVGALALGALAIFVFMFAL
jgi:hypothetical protein